MKIAEVSEKYGLAVDTLAQKESVGGKHKIRRHSISISIRRELCKM
jgi:hypothetical protein